MKTQRYRSIKAIGFGVAVLAAFISVAFLCGCSQKEFQTISQYSAERNAIFAHLQSETLGSTQHISQAERLVDVRMQQMIAEVRQLWGDEPITAESFLEKRAALEQTELYKFFKNMPKGAILHVHPGAMGDYRRLIRMATYREDCYVNMTAGKLGFYGAAPSEDWARCVDLRRSADPQKYDADLLKLITLDQGDLYRRGQIWNNFEGIFDIISVILADRDLYEKFLIDSLRYLRDEENIRHVELRAYISDALDVESWRRVLRSVNATGPRISIVLIGCDIRYNKPGGDFTKRITDNMMRLAMLMEENPDLIVGFDIYAEEDKGYSSAAMVETILEGRRKMADQDWTMPLYLHAGETNRPPSNMTSVSDFELKANRPINDNVIDAVLLGSKRIGHGLGLAYRPAMWELLKDRGICVELNPISNMVLGYTEDLKDHVGAQLLASGVPVSINPDDPGVFGHKGVAMDFLMAAVAWNMDLATCKALAENSLKYSALKSPEKSAAIRDWKGMWDMFILAELAGPESAATSELVVEAASIEHMDKSKSESQDSLDEEK